MKVMISINKSKVPWDELMEACRKDAPLINEAQGDAMEWKIWLENKEESLIGGIYYFKDEEDFKKRMVKGKAKGVLPPLLENVSSQVFDVNVDLSRVNKAPI
jgi:hypothetical protein